MFKSPSALLLVLFVLALCFSSSTRASNVAQPLKISLMKATLFYEATGTFSEDVADEDKGPPYVPPSLWNTPMQYESRSTSVLVVVEVTGEAGLTPERRLEFIARYIPWERESREIVVRKIVPISIPIKTGGKDNFNAGFWLYETGCNPVKLSARIIGQRQSSTVRKVIKFGCGE
jgi:hypothetical protein